MGKSKAQFAALPYRLVHSKIWDGLYYSTQSIYMKMKASWMRRMPDGSYLNKNPGQVNFGLSDMPGGMSRHTYKKGIDELRAAGIIKMLDPGELGRGKKGLFQFINDWRGRDV